MKSATETTSLVARTDRGARRTAPDLVRLVDGLGLGTQNGQLVLELPVLRLIS